jgi:Domain of unknown function (DUF1963)
MSGQINLRKNGPTPDILRLEWAGWVTGKELGTHERPVGKTPIPNASKNWEKKFPTAAAAEAALAKLVAEKLAEGFTYRDEAPPAPVEEEKPSKPWGKAPKVPRPSFLAKLSPDLKKHLAKIRTKIKSAGLAHRSDDIEALLRPTICFDLKAVKPAAIKGVVTRFGGDPDLPEGFVWPKSGKVPLAFVAQYRMEELTKLDLEQKLPKKGLLSLFAQLALGDGYAEVASAFFFEDVKKLTRRAPPHGPDADDRPKKPFLAAPKNRLTLPPPDEDIVDKLKLTSDERSRFHDDVWLATRLDKHAHQLVGWANAGCNDGELLAQLDSDDRLGVEIGDVETLRMYIAPKRLAARDFRKLLATTIEA